MAIVDYKKLLESFKRSNNVRKLVIANREGYATIEAYRTFLENQLIGTKKTVTKKKTVEANLTDMVIAFDTTGSMMSYINAVKSHVIELIPKLFSQNPGLKISIVAFGDYCDMASPTAFGNAYQVIGLTNNENDLIRFVNGAKDTSGGDSDEFYEVVIQKITHETQWREDSNKNVLLIADYNPHPAGFRYGQMISPDWKLEAQQAASKGIIFDTLQILPSIKWYQELSQITGGVCLPFKNSKKTSQLLEATSLARGGKATRSAFMAKSVSSEVTMDADMRGVYSMYKDVVKK